MSRKTDLYDFEDRFIRRFVGDVRIVSAREGIGPMAVPGYPVIEEIEVLSSKKEPRLALLRVYLFDYIRYLEAIGTDHISALRAATDDERAKPKRLEHVTYGSDITDLQIPLASACIYSLVYSETRDRQRTIFTADCCPKQTRGAWMTVSRRGTGTISMGHLDVDLPTLIEVHIGLVSGRGFLENPTLYEGATEAFDAMAGG
jgi:hypothetical protein